MVNPKALDELLERAPEAQVGVELDHQLIGASLAAPTSWRPKQVAQPWDRLGEVAPAIELAPTGSILRGCGTLWLDRLTPDEITRALTVARKATVQQLGLDATCSVVKAAGWPQWRAQMSAEAYLQQVHAGGFGDDALRLLIDNGWVMRGFWSDGEALQVLMWWRNRVR
jgi:hypothetical protein